MKSKAIVLCLLICEISLGQTIDNDVTKVRIDGPNSQILSRANSPLYIITADSKRLQIPDDGNLNDSIAISKTINYINPKWIKSINILKGEDATDQYDSLGQNGVVLIDLKDGSLKNFKPQIRKMFKSY